MTMNSTENQIIDFLRPFAKNDYRVLQFLVMSVGRVLKKQATKGENWRRNANDQDVGHIADWLSAAVANEASWLSNVDEKGIPKKLRKFSSIEQITKEADKAMQI